MQRSKNAMTMMLEEAEAQQIDNVIRCTKYVQAIGHQPELFRLEDALIAWNQAISLGNFITSLKAALEENAAKTKRIASSRASNLAQAAKRRAQHTEEETV